MKRDLVFGLLVLVLWGCSSRERDQTGTTGPPGTEQAVPSGTEQSSLPGVAPSVEPLQERFELSQTHVEPTSNLFELLPKTELQAGNRPFRLKVMPEDLSKKRSWFRAKLGVGELVLVLEQGDAGRLFADTNFNADMSDEKPIPVAKGKESVYGPSRLFGPFTVRNAEGKELVLYVQEMYGRLELIAPHCRSGQVRLEGKSYPVVLVDGNFDGRFGVSAPSASPASEDVTRPDFLGIDLNQDGSIGTSFDDAEVVPLLAVVRLGNEYYSVEPAGDGSSIRLSKAAVETGTLAVSFPDADLVVRAQTPGLAPDAGPVQRLSDCEGKWKLQAGKYTTIAIRLRRKDADGNEWELRSSYPEGEAKQFEIRKDQTTTIKLGPPLELAAGSRIISGAAYLSVTVLGQGKEDYTAGAVKNGKTEDAPSFSILDESGKVLVADKFTYG